MITGQIKSQIDQIWETFWTGGITNSITLLEQMTYLLFMKMLDDAQIRQESKASALGTHVSEPMFDYGTWHNPETDQDVAMADLRWSNFRHFEPEKMYRVVSRDVFSYIKHLNRGKQSAYSRFMKDAVFMIQNPRTLVKVVDGISALDMNNRDAMGDVYEYVLGKMAASGTNGQFRTPRHIIRMMVKLMQPTLDDTICDPAMGSAGFIVESAKYVQEHYKKELAKKSVKEHFRNSMLHGFDTDATMLRIGAMNLMLHDVDNPQVAWQDSLSADNTDTERYSLILANPPFAGSLDNDAVAKSLLTIAKTKKTELLFLALFIRSLRVGGRCASIVPDGVLTCSSKAHKDLRKELVENQCLEAVISMPAGVFLPYSNVSTAILIFTKTNAGGTDKVWFYDMKADGFSLDQKRNEVADNDIPDIIARFHARKAGESERKRTDKSFLVPQSEIIEHGYDLAFNTYKETIREKVEFEPTESIMNRLHATEETFLCGMVELQNMLAQ